MKKLENILVVVIAILMFFGVFNAYAQDSITVDFEGEKISKNTLLEVPEDEDNLVTTEGLTTIGWATNIATTVIPQIFSGYEELEARNDVSMASKRGLIGMLDDGINTLYTNTPNINLYAHLKEEWVPGYDSDKSGIYAASAQSGYEELLDSGISTVWANVRNISYVFFIIIMLVAGFMIMFRHKVGGQALVTLGNALPNVILALILVTFSFAIAGIIIDIGGILMVLAQEVLGLNDYVSTHSIWSLMGEFFNGSGRIWTTVGIGGVGLAATIIGVIGIVGASSGPAGWIILGGVGLIVLLIILLIVGIVFVGSIKVLITLLKAYIGILFNVILAPLQLAMGAIPGNQQMVKNWFNDLFRNVFTFPVVFFIMNLPLAIADTSNLKLGFPEKLVYVNSLSEVKDFTGLAAIFIFVIQIAVFFYAAQAPKYLEAIFPPSSPKAVQEGLAAAKAGLSKIPVVGGIFK